MLNKNGLKTAVLFMKDVLEIVSPVVVTAMYMGKNPKLKHITTYDEAVSAILRSSMFADDKAKAAVKLPIGASPGFYKTIISVVESSMFSNNKLNTIVELCEKVES